MNRPAGSAVDGGWLRWLAGRGLLAGLALMLALNLFVVVRHWSQIREAVTTPPGTFAPDFTLPLVGGEQLHLAEARGEPVVLAFWATWCGPCKMELPHLDRLYHQYRDRVHFYAVNIEDAQAEPTVAAFIKTTGLTIPVAFGGEAVANQYRVDSIPHLVILDRTGKVNRVFDGLHGEREMAGAIEAAIEGR
jgi:thiol-disulfide isomerase/thioredoxin